VRSIFRLVENRGSDELTLFTNPWENTRMIDFQSSAIVERPSHRSCHSPSPGGEGRDEGEQYRGGRQSAQIRVSVFAASVFVRVHPLATFHVVFKHRNYETNPFPPIFQSVSKQFKGSGEKIFFLRRASKFPGRNRPSTQIKRRVSPSPQKTNRMQADTHQKTGPAPCLVPHLKVADSANRIKIMATIGAQSADKKGKNPITTRP
jgi:hypothetical protein